MAKGEPRKKVTRETVENAVANALDAKKHGLRQHWKKV